MSALSQIEQQTQWQQCNTSTFWSDIAAEDHVVQLYDSDAMLIHTLADYAADGFDAGDSVVVIATASHLNDLNSALLNRGYILDPLIDNDRYIRLDADETLAEFMVNGKPVAEYFMTTITALMKRARKNGRRVRAFGEMVVLLWQRGNSSGTLELEALWNKFCAAESLCLFCAYPKSDFNHDAGASVMHVCSAHSKQIRSDMAFPDQLQYKQIR
jgi:hypothetical protein